MAQTLHPPSKKLEETSYVSAYQVEQGQKFFSGTSMGSVKIKVEGKETTVNSALTECAKLSGEVKLNRFREIVGEIGEKFRIKKGEKNDLGLSYNVLSTNPEELLSQKSFNCFSGTITLGQMVAYAASKVGLEKEISVSMQQVASFTQNIRARNWDDAGHAILRIEIKGQPNIFLDTTNAATGNHIENLSSKTGRIVSDRNNNLVYKIGEKLPIDQRITEVAKFQDNLFDNPILSQSDLEKISKMPPVFISYFINYANDSQKSAFFKKFDKDKIAKIESTALQFKLYAAAAVSFDRNSNERSSLEYGDLALKALEKAQRTSSEIVKLPSASYIGATVRIMQMTSNKNNPQYLSALNYLYRTINSTNPDQLKKSGSDARLLLTNFYIENKTTMSKEVAIQYARSIVNINFSVENISEDAKKVLDNVYLRLGINRTEFVNEIVPNTIAGINKNDVLGHEKSISHRIELNALELTDRVLKVDYNFDAISIEIISYNSGDPKTLPLVVLRNFQKMIIKKDIREKLVSEDGVFLSALKSGGLV